MSEPLTDKQLRVLEARWRYCLDVYDLLCEVRRLKQDLRQVRQPEIIEARRDVRSEIVRLREENVEAALRSAKAQAQSHYFTDIDNLLGEVERLKQENARLESLAWERLDRAAIAESELAAAQQRAELAERQARALEDDRGLIHTAIKESNLQCNHLAADLSGDCECVEDCLFHSLLEWSKPVESAIAQEGKK